MWAQVVLHTKTDLSQTHGSYFHSPHIPNQVAQATLAGFTCGWQTNSLQDKRMKKWCKSCQSTHADREGAIVYGENNQSLHWICYACARQAKVSGNGRVRSLADILDEGGSTAVDAALDEVSRIAKAQA